MFRFIFKMFTAAVGAVVGMALIAKMVLESRAAPDTEEIDLVAIFEGVELVSTAQPFYGGKITTMFGGAMLDLRKAQPAPTGMHIDLAVLAGGVSLIVPEGWRVKFEGQTYVGGWADNTRTTADDDVPVLRVTGIVAVGGAQAMTKSPVEAVA